MTGVSCVKFSLAISAEAASCTFCLKLPPKVAKQMKDPVAFGDRQYEDVSTYSGTLHVQW